MGGGQSTQSPPPPPRVIQDPYPTQRGLTNLSLAPGTTVACVNCDIGIDARASTSSVTLTRDFGNISDLECQRYQKDLDAVRNREMAFHDFITNLQAGRYSRPISKSERGEFCEQILFSAEDEAKVTDLATFDANVSKLKNIRIRQVTGGGSFSSGTKAKFKLSLPIKARYVVALQNTPTVSSRMRNFGGMWSWGQVQTQATTPVTEEISISMLTMYHPSPLRIENVQHDAVLSMNDPSDPTAKTIILIPLKSSNTTDESVRFFAKLGLYLPALMSPDSVSGLYPETNIATGNDWNIKQVFWLDKTPTADNVSKVTDAFYTWTGAASFKRVELTRSPTEIRYGWVPDGAQIRYFMLQTPVSISPNDLSFLTRSLPPTPAEEAIHTIPDPATATNPKILYKKATGDAVGAGCTGVAMRERMTNQGQGDMLASLFSGGGDMMDMLVDDKGNPLADMDSCDPFKMNAKKATLEPSMFTPTKAAAYFFNFLIIIALAFGTWLALYFVANKDYDTLYKDFAGNTGKVLGKIALQASSRVSDSAYSVRQSLPGVPSLSGLLPGKTAASGEDMANAASLLGKKPGLGALTGLLGKKSA